VVRPLDSGTTRRTLAGAFGATDTLPGVTTRTAAQLLVECLVAEGCEYVFSVPGEETMDVLDALGVMATSGRRAGALALLTS